MKEKTAYTVPQAELLAPTLESTILDTSVTLPEATRSNVQLW